MEKIMKILFLIGIISLVFISGCTAADACKKMFEDCNYDCGEGILASVCKEKCTLEYNACKEKASEA